MRNSVLTVEHRRLDAPLPLLSLSRPPPQKDCAQKYAAWLEWAARSLKAQSRARLCGPVDLIIRMEERRGAGKASGVIEAVETALTAAGLLLRNDATQLRSVRLVWTQAAGLALEITRAR